MATLDIENWSPKDVSQWIKGLGPQFESHSESFVDEEINGKALLTLNTEYLAELSIENVNDQNAILDAVHCLIEVDTCLQGETVHGQVEIVNNQTKTLIDKLVTESAEAMEGDIKTSESSTKIAGIVYQLAKKLLSWLIRSPFSEMNACWPLKDSVCRVVRDMTDETLLKNRKHLEENLKKLQLSFDNFLNDEPLHEVFKQPPILVEEEFTLEGEGLGIGITTSHHIHTVNSVATESPAGKNGNIKNGDEIVNVNGQCVIAWPQKNVITLMKTKPDTVSLTLKKLPPVIGPLNKPVDKPGTPLSEMNVVMDRTKVPSERPARSEMKEAGIKEETSLEMQAIENENAAEENSKVEERIEGIKEEVEGEGKQENKEDEKIEVHYVQIVPDKPETVAEEEKELDSEEASSKDDTASTNEETKVETEKQEVVEESAKEVGNEEQEKVIKVDEAKAEKVLDSPEVNEGVQVSAGYEHPEIVIDNGETKSKAVEVSAATGGEVVTAPSEPEVEVNGDVKVEEKEQEKVEEKEEIKEAEENLVNGKTDEVAETKVAEKVEVNEPVKEPEKVEDQKPEDPKPKIEESEPAIAIKVDAPSPKKEAREPSSVSEEQNGEDGTASKNEADSPVKSPKEPVSPSKKPNRPELPKMKMGSVKNVTVGGASAKQVEVYGSSKVVRREKKVDGAPNKRISCIELGEADREGWLTKKSGGHGLTPTRWRRQWCVLKEQHMYYYKTSFDREAGGVIDITGYNVSTAPEIKKSFAFKCEKEGAKKYFFHADNEVDRETWMKALNSASRGERNVKEASQLSGSDERKSSMSLKPSMNPANRPRTASVLAGIRFNNIYDDEDVVTHQPAVAATTAQRVNEGLQNGQKEDTAPSTASSADQNVLKIAAGVEEESCQVIPVTELEGGKVAESEMQKVDEDQPKDKFGTNMDNSDQKDAAKDKEGEVCTTNDTSKPEDEELQGEVKTQDVQVDAPVTNGDSVTTCSTANKESAVANEDKTEDKKSEPEVNEQTTTKDSTTKPESDTTKSEDTMSKPEESLAKSENGTEKSEDSTVKSEDGAEKSENIAATKDDFQEVAESIKEADIGIDGSEKSPRALLRKLSVNSKTEIMDKVVQLRVLKQKLKDKEQSMDIIDELLSSDVTPESIADWRAKYETVTNSTSNSSDLNENSAL